MALKAHISPIWRRQKLFIAIFFWAVAAWFPFDGLCTCPRSNERWDALEDAIRRNGPPMRRATAGWRRRRTTFTRPRIFTRSTIAPAWPRPIGTLLFIYWVTQKSRTLRIDGEAVYTPAGSRVPFDSIVGIGKKRWESKGLATVRYQEEGRQRQFVVDDYKFETEPTHQILEEIEERLVSRLNGPN